MVPVEADRRAGPRHLDEPALEVALYTWTPELGYLKNAVLRITRNQ